MSNQWSSLVKDATTNVVQYFVDGVATFDSYVKAIETANKAGHYIYILGWMLDVDFPLTGAINPNYGKPGQTFFTGDKTLLKLLKTATAKGVEVRVLVWKNPLYLAKNYRSITALNQLPNTKAFLDDYTYSPDQTKKTIGKFESTIRQFIERIRPMLNLTPVAQRIVVEYEIAPDALLDLVLHYLSTKNVGAHHEKNLIVKGEQGLLAYCGGIDFNQNRFTSYHDTSCQVKGPEAHQILNRFIGRWTNNRDAKSTPLAGAKDSKPLALASTVSGTVKAKAVGTYNSPDGKDRDRSAKDAYLKILSSARNYIYIDDQYLVNLDVAKVLNKKLKENLFKVLILVVQSPRETTDIMTPNRRRNDFYNAVIEGTNQDEQKKCSLFMLDDDIARSRSRHPGLHAKTLIVDDEIAIIGSMNVNQRSFTLDSETSLIFFNDSYASRDNLAYKFRQSIWNDFVLKPSGLSEITWEEFVRHVNADVGYSLLRSKYFFNLQDLDIRVNDAVRKYAVPLTVGTLHVLGSSNDALQAVSIINSPIAVTNIIDLIFDNIIDPQVQ